MFEVVSALKVDYKCSRKKGDNVMFTVPSSRRIDTHLKYTVKVINVAAVNCMQNAITYSQVNHLDECVAAIEEYRERYLYRNRDYALFVEITTTIAYQDVRLEAFWVDD